MKTLVVQSYGAHRPDWLSQCLQSVRQWSEESGFDYHCSGDEIFDLVPPWYLEKTTGKAPVATDYGRLVMISQSLEAGYDRVFWLDADVLVLDRYMRLDFEGSCAFGQEVWVQPVEGREQRFRAVKNVHNAVCAFKQECPVLPFLIHVTASLIRRVDPERIAPQFAGPKLLTALHNICAFDLLAQVGALSPAVVKDIRAGGGKALDLMRSKSALQPQAFNLCASLITDDSAAEVIDRLIGPGN